MTEHLKPLRMVGHDADAEAAALSRLVQLDPVRAWRADLEEAGLTEPLPEDQAAHWLLWLQVGTTFDRLRMLPVRERAAYARSTAGLWAEAVRVTGTARFARVGEVMAAWRGEAPELAEFRELLWAAEQAEAAGASLTAYCTLEALTLLVVSSYDLRVAYGSAQSARILRTLGLVTQAIAAFEEVGRTARRRDDGWLLARAKLGSGVAHHTRGNFPAARTEFRSALRYASPHTDLLIGAHLGIVSASCTKRSYRSALKHGKMALALATGDTHAEIEALSLLAELHVQVDRYSEAQGYCVAALDRQPRAHKLPCLFRNLVFASVSIGDHHTASQQLPYLRDAVHVTPNPWEHASCEYVIAHTYASWGHHERSATHYTRAYQLADKYGFGEIRWKAENALLALRTREAEGAPEQKSMKVGQRASWSSVDSHDVLDSLASVTARS